MKNCRASNYMAEHNMWDIGPMTRKDRVILTFVEALFMLEIL